MKIIGIWLLSITLFTFTGCGPMQFTLGSSAADFELTETTVINDSGFSSGKIAIIDIQGVLYNSTPKGFFKAGENPLAALHERLDRAEKDNAVKGIILRLNTPGGTVTASDAMYREIMRFKKQTGKPVIILMMDVAASGGYYIACAGDHIVAYPSTITGSIGVIMQLVSIDGLLSRVGVDATAITSGKNKDIASPFKKMTPEQRQILQNMVNDFYSSFRTLVKNARPKIPADKLDTATDGRIFTGKQALQIGLVDQLGDLHDAFNTAKKLTSIKSGKLVLYHRAGNTINSLYQAGATGNIPSTHHNPTQINIAQFNIMNTFGDNAPVFMYLYQNLNW